MLCIHISPDLRKARLTGVNALECVFKYAFCPVPMDNAQESVPTWFI